MKPNLTFTAIAGVLAAVAAGPVALVACGSSQSKPVDSKEVSPGGSAGGGQASCSGNASCGASAHKNPPPGHSSCSASAHCGSSAHAGGDGGK